MATSATIQPHPMPHTVDDFNKVLEQEVVFFNEKGQETDTQFHSAFNNAEKIAQGLLERLNGRIAHFKSKGESGREGIQEELATFKEQYNHFAAIVALADSIRGQFTEMLTTLNESSKSEKSKPIMAKADVQPFIDKLIIAVASLTSKYLTKGTVQSYLPDRLTRLEGLVPKKA